MWMHWRAGSAEGIEGYPFYPRTWWRSTYLVPDWFSISCESHHPVVVWIQTCSPPHPNVLQWGKMRTLPLTTRTPDEAHVSGYQETHTLKAGVALCTVENGVVVGGQAPGHHTRNSSGQCPRSHDVTSVAFLLLSQVGLLLTIARHSIPFSAPQLNEPVCSKSWTTFGCGW